MIAGRRVLPILAAVCVALLAVGFMGPVADVDAWWHLASGRWMAGNFALPAMDPFAVWGAVDSSCARTVLNSQWLGQLAMFGSYRLAAESGVEGLRVLLLLAAAALVALRAKLAGAGPAAALAAGVLAGFLLTAYAGDRPQLFSFALFGALFLLLEAAHRSASARASLAACAVLLLWVQLHGASLLGALAASAYACGALLQSRREGTAPTERPRGGYAWMVLALAAPLLTLAGPSGFDAWICVASPGDEFRARVGEYQAPHELLMVVPQLWVWAACLALLPLAAWRWWREGNLGRIFVAAAMALVSLQAFRYVPFLVLLVLPWLAAALPPPGRRGSAALLLVAIVVAAAAAIRAAPLVAPARSDAEAAWFPRAAIMQLAGSQTSGRLFTTLGWGGYALWHLHPRHTPYVDGRWLEPRRVAVYTHMLWLTPFGREAFEREGFAAALLPWTSARGEAYPLATWLRTAPEWRVVQETPAYLLVVRDALQSARGDRWREDGRQ